MAFEFIVEDGTIVAGANSYISLDEASDLLAPDIAFSATWAGLDQGEQERRLAYSTAWLDLAVRWEGRRVETTQALQWPRCGATDRDGCQVSEVIIPVEVKQATLAAVRFFYSSDANNPAEQVGIRRFRADTIELEWQDGFSVNLTPPGLRLYLNGLGNLLAGPGFKPVRRV